MLNRFVAFIMAVLMIITQSGAAKEVRTGSVNVIGNDFQTDIKSKSYALYEINTDSFILSYEGEKRLPPASVTKVMTLLLIYEALDNKEISYKDMVTVSEHAASMGGSQVYLEPDEIMSVEDLIKCIIISSANDACVAMAEKIAGSEEAFVNRMNDKAAELKMNNTNFVNCCGLDADNHYSCANDIAIMSAMLLRNHPDVTIFTTKWMDTITHNTRRGSKEFGLTNTNKLINNYEGLTGLKTGSTSQAGFCLSASAKRDNTYLVAVVMGAESGKERFMLARQVLNYGFANIKVINIDEDRFSTDLRLRNTINRNVKVRPARDCCILVDKSVFEDNITVEFKLNKNIKNYNKPVGDMIIYNDKNELYKVPVYISDEVKSTSFRYYLSKIFFS